MRITKIRKINGIAGQIAFTATVEHDGGEVTSTSFIGSHYGVPGPVLMTFDTGGQTWVTEPERFGDSFNEAWVKEFYRT